MINSRERAEDVSTLLFLVPFIGAFLDTIYQWSQVGFSLGLPSIVYLDVTRDPYVFLVGTLAVFAGLAIDVSSADPSNRKARVARLSVNLQEIAVAAFVLSLLAAFYANGGDPSQAGLSFVVGRYSIVFPAMLVLLSYLLVTPWNGKGLANNTVYGILIMLIVPVEVDEVGKRDTFVALLIAFLLIIAGVYLLSRSSAKAKEE